MKYKMKIDLWINILLNASVLMFIPIYFTIPEGEKMILIIIALLMAIIIYPFFYGYYELRDDLLFIRIGFIHQRIYYEKIKSLRICKNWLSSMAMTSKRIEIKEHKKGYIMGTTFIGPKNREEMFEDLKRRCWNLEE